MAPLILFLSLICLFLSYPKRWKETTEKLDSSQWERERERQREREREREKRNGCARLHGVDKAQGERGWCVGTCVHLTERERQRKTGRELRRPCIIFICLNDLLNPQFLPVSPSGSLYGVKQGFSKSWSCPQIWWAHDSSQKVSPLRKTLSVRFIFNCWLVTINPSLQNHKTILQSFSAFRQDIKLPGERKENCRKKALDPVTEPIEAAEAGIYALMATLTWYNKDKIWLDGRWLNWIQAMK